MRNNTPVTSPATVATQGRVSRHRFTSRVARAFAPDRSRAGFSETLAVGLGLDARPRV